jgi:nucleoside diphosphate-linked moiety X motif protein 19
VPRLSASLILIKPLSSPTQDGYNYRTLLVQRQANGSFRSAHVFPGGNIDKTDKEASWISPKALTPVQALKLCAIRETFEECGILIATNQGASNMTEEARKSWRKRVHDDATQFQQLFTELSTKGSTVPDIQALVYRGNFVTPTPMKKRWDTHFFLSVLPPAEEERVQSDRDLIVTSDGVETISADWFTPLEAVSYAIAPPPSDPASYKSTQSIILAPPQFYFLSELLPLKDWRELLQSGGGERARKRKVVPFVPEFKLLDPREASRNVAMVLPGDPLHSMTPLLSAEPKPDALHRSYVIPASKSNNAGDLRLHAVYRRGMTSILGAGWEDIHSGNEVTSHEPVNSKL